jgi:uncharacterized protein YceK
MQRKLFVACMAAIALTGCSTTFRSSQPALASGKQYVVGAKAGFWSLNPRVWVCPDNGGDCQKVEVDE